MSTSPGPVVPADRTHEPAEALKVLQATLGLSAAVLGVFSTRQPEIEGVLAAGGVDAARLKIWCREIGAKDATWREARRQGIAYARRPDAGAPVRGEHVLTGSLPASLDGTRFWYLACGRDSAFTPAEELTVRLVLRHRQVAMDHVGERGMSRVLVGRDDRLLHADPDADAALSLADGALAAWMAVVRPAVAQRWGDLLEPGRAYDAVVPLPDPGGPRWVRLRRQSPVSDLPGHLLLELRPVGPDDPPALGVMEDERLAQALAYLADRYPKSPGLEEVAEAAHISPFHFHRLFTRAAGVSPKHYLLRTQLMIAKWQLRATHRPVRDIAAETGFASHGHFTATFHRMVGLSPTAYREREGA